MKKYLKFIAFFLIMLTLASMAAGCAPGGEKLASIKESGKLTVYTDPNFPPFEFIGADGIIGVDMEIGKAIADELGVDMVIVESEFDAILMAIKGGKGDIAITGMTIKDDRKESVDFSIPYINSVQYLILPEESNIEFMEDLAGKTVGVALGYTGQFLMEDELDADIDGVLAGSGTEIKEYPSAMEAMLDMQNKRTDAVVMDEYVAKNIAANNSGLKAVELRYKDGAIASEEYGVVVAKGNEDLLKIIDKVVKRLTDEGKIREWMILYS
ncbi:MAG: transporter substrate-binding domain-containing protein [Oscillospiraceae bacterium]|nr:transporter substrate-binding domain-containing protein [Oscillospiraceae bacterium]